MNADSSFLMSENILVAAYNRNPTTGAAGAVENSVLDPYDIASYIPIGVLENVGVSQQRTIQQIWEIGSRKAYLVPGRTVIQVTLNRVLLNGDSLLRVLYPTLEGDGGSLAMVDYAENVMSGAGVDNIPGTYGGRPSKPDLWFNLASQFFSKPTHLALFFYDANHVLQGQIILADSLAETLNFGISADQNVVTENVRLRVTDILSVSAPAVTT
jgi:hypothetical protein